MAAATPSSPTRLGGGADDPLLRADIAKREKAEQAQKDKAQINKLSENRVEECLSSQAEENKNEMDQEKPSRQGSSGGDPGSEHFRDQDAESAEKALAKQRFVRSVLCTRLAIPSAENVSNSVLRAVLCGDANALVEASRRGRLKGVAVALTADDRKRTALHLAVGIKDINMVRALMRWRRELNNSLEDKQYALDQRRDLFVQRCTLASTVGRRESVRVFSLSDVEQFEEWLFEERQRLVRETELRCEEYWRKAVTARDDKGRTPLHWAASVSCADSTLLQALLTNGRADLSVSDTNHGTDGEILAGLKAKVRARTATTTSDGRGGSPFSPVTGTRNLAVFPHGEKFHRRTGKLCRRGERGGAKTKRGTKGRGKEALRESSDGLTANKAKVQWFCGALAKTAERLSASKRGGAEAFLLSVFEDFDRKGDGVLSIGQFREALRDVNVRVSEQTLIEVGRYFQTPTLRTRYGRHDNGEKGSWHGNGSGDRGTEDDCALIEVFYVPLVDVVFGRKDVRENVREGSRYRRNRVEDQTCFDKERLRRGMPRERTATYEPEVNTINEEERLGNADCYVDVCQVRAARFAVLETTDALGRPPLFLAAAAGMVPAAKALIRHGASSALAIGETGLTAYSVAPSLLMRRILAAEARQSLDHAIAVRNSDHAFGDITAVVIQDGLVRGTPQEEKEEESRERGEVGEEKEIATAYEDDMNARETHRMEVWISTLADGEVSLEGTNETRTDQKTSLHLASAAGLPEAVKAILKRRAGNTKQAQGNGSARPAWEPLSQLAKSLAGGTRLNTAHSAFDHHNPPQKISFKKDLVNTDVNGWTPLHSCCATASLQHYYCAINLLGSNWNPNLKTNTGETPLHLAACAGGSAEGNLIPLLVSHGADLEAKNGDGFRPLHLAAKEGRHVALLALLTAGANAYSVTPRRWNALHYAMATGDADATRLLAYWDSDSGILGKQKNCAGVTPMALRRTNNLCPVSTSVWEAAALGQVELISRTCLESSYLSKDTAGKPWACPGVNSKTPGLGFTPLHACMAGLGAIMKGVDVSPPCTPPQLCGRQRNKPDISPQPSLYARLAREQRRLTSSAGGNKTTEGIPISREVRYCYANRPEHHLGACRALLSAAADVNACDTRCRTPLALAAASGSLEAVEILLEEGADPQAIDTDGNTPAHFALAYANAAIAAVLVREGADLEARNGKGKTPQDVAGLCKLVAPSKSGGSSQVGG